MHVGLLHVSTLLEVCIIEGQIISFERKDPRQRLGCSVAVRVYQSLGHSVSCHLSHVLVSLKIRIDAY